MPLQLTWKGLITFAGEGGGLPTYADADVPTLPIPAQGETNYLTLRPLVPQPAPAPDLFVNLLVAFQADSSGVNRAYINGATNPGPSSADLSSPPLLAYLSAAGGPLSSGSPTQGSTLAGSATQPFVVPYGKVIEVYINNTDVRSALFVQPHVSLSAQLSLDLVAAGGGAPVPPSRPQFLGGGHLRRAGRGQAAKRELPAEGHGQCAGWADRRMGSNPVCGGQPWTMAVSLYAPRLSPGVWVVVHMMMGR